VTKNQTYLITGGSGFIGRRMCNAIISSGFNLHLILRRRIKDIDCKQFISDLDSGVINKEAFIGVDTIFHLAGFAHDIKNNNNIKKYQEINVNLTIQIAKLAVINNVKNIVFMSSVKAGGSFSFLRCMTEKDQVEPIDSYGKSKRTAELELLKIGKENNIRVSIIRPALVYGPEVKGNLKIMLSAVKKGWFPPLPSTGNKRSLIHVDDLVRATILVSNTSSADGEIYIATDGKNYSSSQIYQDICKVVGKPLPKWSLPKSIFNLASFISPKLKFKINKLLGDECYSSKKLVSLGFKPIRRLEEMNETSF
jgi:UDP-glucose 4-epimerase